ncbi:MAG: sigma-54 dependent transcriptional regulator [Bdellovibrio sp.]
MAIRPTIFVIEDDLDTQEMIVRFLSSKAYRAKGFSNAEDPIEILKKDPEACDVLLTDFLLPKMSGMDLINALLQEGVKAPIILMTAQKTSDLAAEATRAGAYDFITKPLRFPQLAISIERAIDLAKIREENELLKTVVAAKEGSNIENLIGKSPKFLQALDLAKRVANGNSSVLITGESGSGKEVIARTIHGMGKGEKFPFIAINCTAIPENLLESELFGHAKGAFTGAIDRKIGLFEEAHRGTLFLDEIGDMSLPLQAKLLRAIQEKKIKRVGENQLRPIDVRIISATNKNFKREIANKNFREDLFYRLNVIQIHVPPLRERPEDVLPLADFFLKKFVSLNNSTVSSFSSDAKEFLLRNQWRGNVRELENTVERAVVLSAGKKLIGMEVLQEYAFDDDDQFERISAEGGFYIPRNPIVPLEEVVQRYMSYVLERNAGAKDQTARDLGINRKTLYLRLRENKPQTDH